MEHAYIQFLHLLGGHTGWTLTVVFVAAFLEAIAIIGTFVPGSTALFVAGALVGTGSLNLGWLLAIAIAGAIAGDGISYWIGHRYRDTIARMWPFRTHPKLLDRGYQYFDKYGAKAVVFGRFVGPLRAVVPVVAGMLKMPPARFYAMNVLSAVLWAPAHILPGVVFGASIQLAGDVSFRLVAALAIVVGVVWLIHVVTRFVLSHAHAWAITSQRRIVQWARHHRGRAGRFVLHVVDPEQHSVILVVAISFIVLLCAGIFFGVLQDVVSGEPLVQIDLSVYRFMRSIHSPWLADVLARVTALGTVPTLTALIATAVLWMVYERRWRTVVYWVIAVAFSQVLIVAIQLIVHRASPWGGDTGEYGFPSNHVAASVIVYGFLGFILARRLHVFSAIVVTTVGTAILLAIAFAGVYSGRFAFSDAIGGAVFAVMWVAIVALTAVWRNPHVQPTHPWMPLVVLAVICISVVLQYRFRPDSLAMPPMASRPTIVVSEAQWTDSLWKTFPCYRSDLKGDHREPITVQWSADAGQIAKQLGSRGWVPGMRVSARSLFSLISPNVPAMDLPVLPKLNDGEPSTLVFARQRERSDERDVLRFWQTSYAVQRKPGGEATPIWLGSLVHERLLRPSWPFNVLRTDRQLDSMISEQGRPEWQEFQMSRGMGCKGVPITLIAR
jgi:membrane protein DedA with SNARE-associated domain/membrane-associated phospholipid phosphatase